MVDKKNFLKIIKLPLLLVVLFSILFLMPTTFSRYQNRAVSNTGISVAYYVVDANYFTDEIFLTDLLPSSEPYVYNFDVSNFKRGKRTETNIEYELSIRTTTNLPLRYYLYLNESYTTSGAQSIISSDVTALDSDNTYFRTMKANIENFTYTQDQTNHYQLVVYFPETFDDYDYQDVYESIEITIDSRQKLDSDTQNN